MTVVVTGAAGGIGRAVAEAFMDAGDSVVGHDLSPMPEGSRFAGWVSGDLRDASTREALFDAATGSTLDSVVLAHGIAGAGAVEAIQEPETRRIMQIDFETCVDTAAALRPLLEQSSGSLVVISSQAGLLGEGNNAIYCAAKFALVGWLRGAEWGNVRVRALCPGVTDTPLLQSALQGMADAEGVSYVEIVQRRNDNTLVGRLAEPAEMGASAVWLAKLRTPGFVTAPVTGGEVVH